VAKISQALAFQALYSIAYHTRHNFQFIAIILARSYSIAKIHTGYLLPDPELKYIC